MKCKVQGCEKEARYKLMCLCSTHYNQQWQYKSRYSGSLDQVWAEAARSVRAAREQQARCDAAMRRAGGAQ